uniref:PH domain-containing protein n=1 Tax=Rhabditophanes sp. KR3021 TaxID=114890 RepID=A0AC35THM8_9BILA
MSMLKNYFTKKSKSDILPPPSARNIYIKEGNNTHPIIIRQQDVKDKNGILRSLSFQFSPFRSAKVVNSSDAVNNVTQRPAYVPDQRGKTEVGPLLGVQAYGNLMKKFKKKNRPAKWKKRFFILKECFLLYYSCNVRHEFESTKKINLNPKGIFPLINCSIISGGDVGRNYCLIITHCQFETPLIVCTSDIRSQEIWLKALREAANKNTIYGENMIRELESKEVMLNEEKKNYEERLEKEASKRKEEKIKNLELERTKEELENEREKLLRLTRKMKEDMIRVKGDLKETNKEKLNLEREKIGLLTKTEHLVTNMESLNMEKNKIEEHMSQILQEREKFLLENQSLSCVTSQLKNRMLEIESKTSMINTEKENIEALMRLNEQKTVDLERERHHYNYKTQELMSNLKMIYEQKEMTEAELKDEVLARIAAERELRAAERALEHLENALRLTGAQMTEIQEHIMPNVHRLKDFFEKCSIEANMEASKAYIMRNAVIARRSFRRSNQKGKAKNSLRKHASMKEDRRSFEVQSFYSRNSVNELDEI